MLRLTGLVLALATLAALGPAQTLAQTKAGVVTNLEGTATAARTVLPQPLALKFRDDVFQNDRIVTGDRSIVRMLLGGKAVVTVRERSSLTITEVPGKSTIDLDNGKIAVAVAKERMQPGESVEVKTPNAVAAVRGTVFIIEVIRATAQGPGAQAVSGVTTNAYGFGGSFLLSFLSGQTFNVGAGNVAGGTGSQLATFGIMTPQQVQSAPAGLQTSNQTLGGGQNGAKDNAMGATLATFGQGGGLPQLGAGAPPPPIPQPPRPTPFPGGTNSGGTNSSGGENGGGGFKPAGILVFGDRGPSSSLSADLASLGRTVAMNVTTLPADLSSFGNIWHVSAFTALTTAEQTRLADFLALGRGLYLTGERPCCETLNSSIQSFLRSVVAGGSGIRVGGLGDFFASPFPFNPTARGGITTGPNVLTTWVPDAPGGISGISGANVLVTAPGGTAVGGVWDSGDLVGVAGRLVLLMDSDWLLENASSKKAVIQDIQTFIDAPPAALSLNGPLFRSTNEVLDTATSLFSINDYTVTGSSSNPLLWFSGSRVTTAGNFVRMIDSLVGTAGSFTRLDDGAQIVQTVSAQPLVAMSGGMLAVGTGGAGHLFDLAGRPNNTQTDGDTGLTLGMDQPLQPGPGSPVFQATNGAVVTVAGSAYRVDTALLEATAPLLVMAAGSSLTTNGHTVDLVNRAKVSIPNDAVAMISLNGSVLNVNNANLVNVAGGSQLSIAGSLLSLSGGSTLNILNGLLLNVTGGSSAGIGNSLVSFGGSGNLLSVTNSFAPTAIIGGVPVYGPGGSFQIASPSALAGLGTAGTIKINGVALTSTTPLSSLTGSLVAVQGSGKVKVGN